MVSLWESCTLMIIFSLNNMKMGKARPNSFTSVWKPIVDSVMERERGWGLGVFKLSRF